MDLRPDASCSDISSPWERNQKPQNSNEAVFLWFQHPLETGRFSNATGGAGGEREPQKLESGLLEQRCLDSWQVPNGIRTSQPVATVDLVCWRGRGASKTTFCIAEIRHPQFKQRLCRLAWQWTVQYYSCHTKGLYEGLIVLWLSLFWSGLCDQGFFCPLPMTQPMKHAHEGGVLNLSPETLFQLAYGLSYYLFKWDRNQRSKWSFYF